MDSTLMKQFEKMYLNGLYTDHEIILRDAKGMKHMKIHKIILIGSSEYFEKTWNFASKPVENPLYIDVVDARLAKKIIEEFYGIEFETKSTYDILTYMIIRDYFSLPNDPSKLAKIQVEGKYYDLLLKVLYQFKFSEETARILNRNFFPIERVDADGIELFRKNDLEITPKMEELMIEQDLRYKITMRINRNKICVWNTHEDKYEIISENMHYNTYGLTCSVDGTLVIVNMTDIGNIASTTSEVWNTKTRTIIKKFTNDTGGIFCISPDNNLIIYSRGIEVVAWNIKDSQSKSITVAFPSEHSHYINNISFFPNGKYFTVIGTFTLHIYEASTLIEVNQLHLAYDIISKHAFSPIYRYYAFTTQLGIHIMTPPFFQNKHMISLPYTKISHICFSPDSNKILVVCRGEGIKIYDIETTKLLQTITIEDSIECISWPDAKCIIFATDNKHIIFFDVNIQKIIRKEKMAGDVNSISLQKLCFA